MTKSITIVYILWFLGGTIGLHHIYLERPDHAFLYAISGGAFGVGWLRDLVRIPAYTRVANGDLIDQEIQKLKLKHDNADADIIPPFSFARFIAEWFFANVCGAIISSLVYIPVISYDAMLYTVISIPGALFGAWFVAQLGDQYCDWRAMLKLTTYGTIFDLISGSSSIRYLCAALSAQKARNYRKTSSWKDNIGICKGMGWYLLLTFGFWVLVFFGVMLHGAVQLESGEIYYLRDSYKHIRNMEYWKEFNFTHFYESIKDGKTHDYFATTMDITGKRQALHELGFGNVDIMPDVKQVKSRYHQMALKYHPDKFVVNEMTLEQANEKFMKIQEAYEVLKTINKAEERAKKYKKQKRKKHPSHHDL